MKKLLLPALTGQFANWTYFEVIMKVEDIVHFELVLDQEGEPVLDDEGQTVKSYRVKTVEEVDQIYSQKGVGNLLQREFDKRRLNPIKEYLLNQQDSYINNITIAIYDGTPEWLAIDLGKLRKSIDAENTDFENLEKNYGILQLNGDETMFVLDGQHRVKGLREAAKESSVLKEQEIAITLITHLDNPQGKRRTRRLFSTINRHAVPVSFSENILLDEDDLSAIIVRELIEKFPLFKNQEVIAIGKSDHLNLPTDADKLTNIRSLWNINEIIIDNSDVYAIKPKGNKYLRIRPSEEKIQKWRKTVFFYWELFFSLFPTAKSFIDLNNDARRKFRDERNLFYLRPIGQEIIFTLIKELEKKDPDKIKKISNIEPNLDSSFWRFVLYDPVKQTMKKKKSYARDYLKYHFGMDLTPRAMSKLQENYVKESGETESSLPPREFN